MSQNAIDFKLLAIKPLDKCSKKYRNNLKPDTLYKFYQYYDFKPAKGSITEIEKTGSDFNIYNDFIPESRNLNISISAIVGKNGSGKSSLVELFYLTAYLVAYANGLLVANELSPSGKRQANELKNIKADLKLEVYYKVADQYRCIVMDEDYDRKDRESSNIKFYDLFGGEKVPFADFFYSIIINYSIYGLNESVVGSWIGKLFHKNDGYQTPIVINPFRDRGTININGEIHFAQTRLLSNIRFDKGEINEIVPGKGIKEIVFVINRMKLMRPGGHHIDKIMQGLQKETTRNRTQIFEEIYAAMLGESPDYKSMAEVEWQGLTINYVIGKVIRIAKNYPEYKVFYTEDPQTEIPGLKDFDKYLQKLKDDMTHVTLKLRQALNFFRNDPLKLNDDRIRQVKGRIIITAELFAERLSQNRDSYPDRDPMEFVPIAPFSPQIILEGGQEFHKMSSGEQQFVHSIQGVLYHILNVDSVFRQLELGQKSTYPYINIIFDEIELYFHPEYQRRFVSELLKSISRLSADNIRSINVLFLTHSPFVLSDIPAVNVLQLESGAIVDGQLPTFAGNIHRMLSSSFFMKSTTGEFSKFQCDEIIRFYEKVREADKNMQPSISQSLGKNPQRLYNSDMLTLRQEYIDRRERFVFVVDQIGEQVVSGVLKNHLAFIDEKLLVESQEDLLAKKKRIEQELDELNKKITGSR